MRNIRFENLLAMVDFFYHGEANVYQENLDSFLVLAEELQLKGLRGNQTDREAEVSSIPTKLESPKPQNYRSSTKQFPEKEIVLNESGIVQGASEKTIALKDQATNNSDIESLNKQVKSMMVVSENATPHQRGRARICKVCGKEGSMRDIMDHIEAKHIAGISIPCDICERVFKKFVKRPHISEAQE